MVLDLDWNELNWMPAWEADFKWNVQFKRPSQVNRQKQMMDNGRMESLEHSWWWWWTMEKWKFNSTSNRKRWDTITIGGITTENMTDPVAEVVGRSSFFTFTSLALLLLSVDCNAINSWRQDLPLSCFAFLNSFLFISLNHFTVYDEIFRVVLIPVASYRYRGGTPSKFFEWAHFSFCLILSQLPTTVAEIWYGADLLYFGFLPQKSLKKANNNSRKWWKPKASKY